MVNFLLGRLYDKADLNVKNHPSGWFCVFYELN